MPAPLVVSPSFSRLFPEIQAKTLNVPRPVPVPRILNRPEPPPDLVPAGAKHGRQVSAITGCSLRQLQWWDEKGAVKPVHIKHRRWYTPEQVRDIGMLMELRRRGVSLQRARQLLRTEAVKGSDRYIVLGSGRRVKGCPDAYSVVAELVKMNQPALVIERL